MVRYLVFGITYAFAAAVQPGPFQSYLIAQTLSKGWRHTLPAAFSPMLSDGPIIVLVLLLLTNMPGGLVQILQIAGGVFLLYLAAGAFRAWRAYDVSKVALAPTSQQTVLKAALVNLLNPAPYLGWSLVMGPLLLAGWRETPANGVALLLGFYGTMVTSLAGIIMLFAAARSLGPQVSRVLLGVSALALACFGLYEMWLGTRTFWWQ